MKLICTLKDRIVNNDIRLYVPEGTIVEVVKYKGPTKSYGVSSSSECEIIVVAQSALLDDQIVLDYPLTVPADFLKFFLNT